MSALEGRTGAWVRVVVAAAFVVSAIGLPSGTPSAQAAITPKAVCGPGALPETDIQGRVPTADYDDGRVKLGYQCNAEQVGHDGDSGGFRTYRYVDAAGHECAYYDTTLL